MIDVAVVGGGIAGLAAALGAKDAGAKVRVFEAHAGGSALSSGAWDVASDLSHPGGDGLPAPVSLDDAIERLAAARATHPYARLGAQRTERVKEAHLRVLGALPAYGPLSTDARGTVVASDLGILRGIATAQRSMLALDPEERRPIAVIDLRWAGTRGGGAFDAAFIAKSLSWAWTRVAPEHFFSVLVKCEWEGLRRASQLYEIAYELDGAGTLSRFANALAEALHGRSIGGVLLPSVLGIENEKVAEALSEALGVPVGEALSSLSSPQSLRLTRAIGLAFDREDVPRSYGRVRAVRHVAGSPVLIFEDGKEERAGAVVLATGKYVGGGIVYGDGAPREPLAGLPIFLDGVPLRSPALASGFDPLAMFGADPFRGGDGFRIGVGYDEGFRAIGLNGQAIPDLFVCGGILEGVDPARDGSGLGVAATTGYFAGRSAAAHR